ncbi:MAG: HD domain-containing protein [Candidatus Woesebacteria bacterium]
MPQLITDIYKKYKIPPNLVRHQLEVTAVGRFICDHWTGEPVDKDKITQILLLHDMGNIIKFKRPFLGESEPQSDYWESVQAEFIAKYGNDVHLATQAIFKELGKAETLSPWLDDMHLLNRDPKRPISWDVRIIEYADNCVTPGGIVGFEARLQDLMFRYHHTEDEPWVQLLRENAKLVQEKVDADLRTIDTADFSGEIDRLKGYAL